MFCWIEICKLKKCVKIKKILGNSHQKIVYQIPVLLISFDFVLPIIDKLFCFFPLMFSIDFDKSLVTHIEHTGQYFRYAWCDTSVKLYIKNADHLWCNTLKWVKPYFFDRIDFQNLYCSYDDGRKRRRQSIQDYLDSLTVSPSKVPLQASLGFLFYFILFLSTALICLFCACCVLRRKRRKQSRAPNSLHPVRPGRPTSLWVAIPFRWILNLNFP